MLGGPWRVVAEVPAALSCYLRLGWWGLVAPRVREREPLVVVQAVVLGERGVLLAVRADLRGWELPGGTLEPGESSEQALGRELAEETGLEVEGLRHVGDYRRSGFRPHLAVVYACRPASGSLRVSSETRVLRWFDPAAPPDTLFPWYRQPLGDAIACLPEPVERWNRQGLRDIVAGMQIDLRMRLTGDRAG